MAHFCVGGRWPECAPDYSNNWLLQKTLYSLCTVDFLRMLEVVYLTHSESRWTGFCIVLSTVVCARSRRRSALTESLLNVWIHIFSLFFMSTYSMNLPPPATSRQTDASTVTYWLGRMNASNLSILACQGRETEPPEHEMKCARRWLWVHGTSICEWLYTIWKLLWGGVKFVC